MLNRWAEWTDAYPWEQQPGETDRAYRAFVVYRDMGANRSLRLAAQRHFGLAPDDPATNQKRHFAKWSHANRWVERCSQFDAFSDYQRWAEKQTAIREMEGRHAAIAINVQRAALDKLEELSPREMSAGDVIRFLEKAVQIERLARGEATARNEVQGQGGGPIEVAIGIEELEERVVQLLEMRQDDVTGDEPPSGDESAPVDDAE